MKGLKLIAKERQRQIEVEGYSPEQDQQYKKNELFMAACCYVSTERMREVYGENRTPPSPPANWPWDAESWKPTPDDRIRELVKAGALFRAQYDLDKCPYTLTRVDYCATEIDRLRLEEGDKELPKCGKCNCLYACMKDEVL